VSRKHVNGENAVFVGALHAAVNLNAAAGRCLKRQLTPYPLWHKKGNQGKVSLACHFDLHVCTFSDPAKIFRLSPFTSKQSHD